MLAHSELLYVATQVEHIREHVAPGLAVLVTGDFNAGEETAEVEIMRSAGFVDTFRVLYPNETNVGTFHGFSGNPGADKIDYVFASGPGTALQPVVRAASVVSVDR